MTGPNQDPGLSQEITPEQTGEFVKAVRRLLDVPVPSYTPIPTEGEYHKGLEDIVPDNPDMESAARSAWDELFTPIDDPENKDLSEASHGNLSIDSRADYQLGVDFISLGDLEGLTASMHTLQMIVVGPSEVISDIYYKKRIREFKVDIERMTPSYKELDDVYERGTNRPVRPERSKIFARALRNQESFARFTQEADSQRQLEEMLGLTVFNQQRYQDAMGILSQLGPHNRLDS